MYACISKCFSFLHHTTPASVIRLQCKIDEPISLVIDWCWWCHEQCTLFQDAFSQHGENSTHLFSDPFQTRNSNIVATWWHKQKCYAHIIRARRNSKIWPQNSIGVSLVKPLPELPTWPAYCHNMASLQSLLGLQRPLLCPSIHDKAQLELHIPENMRAFTEPCETLFVFKRSED